MHVLLHVGQTKPRFRVCFCMMLTQFVASDALSSTKVYRRHNYVYSLNMKKVVLWKDGRKNALDIQRDELWTTETKSIQLIHLHMCCFKEPVFDILRSQLSFDNMFFSNTRFILAPKCVQIHFVCIDNVLFCVSSISSVVILIFKRFVHAQEIGWTLILIIEQHVACALSNFCTRIEQKIHRYLSN